MTEKQALQILRSVGPWHEEISGKLEQDAREFAQTSPKLTREFLIQVPFDEAAAPALDWDLPPTVDAKIHEYVDKFSHRKYAKRFTFRDPAMMAVAAAFLVLVALMGWIYLANEGGFAGMNEVKQMVQVGNSAGVTEYDEMDASAETLDDWFTMQGFDGFRVPEEFADNRVVGARLFTYEGERVAAAAVPIDERRAFFYSFEAHPFGVSIQPEGKWSFTTFGAKDGNVLAARQVGSKCFVVTFEGTKPEMEGILRAKGALKP